MELTKKQFAKIEHLMPVARKPATISNYQFLCALLYIIENGCKWRALPKKYGNWHSVYMKFSRWSKNGTIQKIFDEMQKMGLIKTDTDALCIDSTSIKVHPDAAGARKSNGSQDIGRSRGADDKTPSLLYLRTVRVCLPSVCREPPWCPRRQEADWGHLFRRKPSPFDGQGIWRW